VVSLLCSAGMKKRVYFLMKMLDRLKAEFGYQYIINRTNGDFGYIEFKNGRRHYVTRGDIRVNRTGPHLLAGDKYYTDTFLKKHGYPVVKSELFYSESFCRDHNVDKGLEAGIAFADTLGYPTIVKPNEGLHGNGVQKVTTERELRRAMLRLFKDNEKVLVQRFAKGDDYRVVVYDGGFVSAYRRVPLTIVGNGTSSIEELIRNKVDEYAKASRRLTLELDKMKLVLKRQGLNFKSVPAKGEAIRLLDNANLSAGGYAEDVSNIIHKDYKKIAINAARDLGLRLSGVDLMVQSDITEAPKKGKWFFLELNASPGFDSYARLSDQAYQRIEKLFKKILKDIEKGKIQN